MNSDDNVVVYESLVLDWSLRISRIVNSFHHDTLTWFRKCRIGPQPGSDPPIPSIAGLALVNPRRNAVFPVWICNSYLSTSGLVALYSRGSQKKASPRRHRYTRWNFADILSGSGDTCISSLEARILVFSTSGLVAKYSCGSQWKAGPRKHRYSRWNSADIWSVSGETCILSLEAAILILSTSGLVA